MTHHPKTHHPKTGDPSRLGPGRWTRPLCAALSRSASRSPDDDFGDWKILGISWGYGDIMGLPAGNLKITIWKTTIFTGKIGKIRKITIFYLLVIGEMVSQW